MGQFPSFASRPVELVIRNKKLTLFGCRMLHKGNEINCFCSPSQNFTFTSELVWNLYKHTTLELRLRFHFIGMHSLFMEEWNNLGWPASFNEYSTRIDWTFTIRLLKGRQLADMPYSAILAIVGVIVRVTVVLKRIVWILRKIVCPFNWAL